MGLSQSAGRELTLADIPEEQFEFGEILDLRTSGSWACGEWETEHARIAQIA